MYSIHLKEIARKSQFFGIQTMPFILVLFFYNVFAVCIWFTKKN